MERPAELARWMGIERRLEATAGPALASRHLMTSVWQGEREVLMAWTW